jgi:ferredoxin like protein
MSDGTDLKAKLGLDVFKPLSEPHIRIRSRKERDERLLAAVRICPAGLYSRNDQGDVVLTTDGCLECGTCRLLCTTDVLEWRYPEGGTGVQFRFG